MSQVTRILDSIAQGDAKAAEELLPLVYDELRKLAAHKMASQPPGQTLQPTALVHEAWLRLAGKQEARFADRTHFFAAAAQAMRCILIANARRKHSQKHGGGWEARGSASLHAVEAVGSSRRARAGQYEVAATRNPAGRQRRRNRAPEAGGEIFGMKRCTRRLLRIPTVRPKRPATTCLRPYSSRHFRP